VAMRPARPLDTVVLEEEQKDQLLSDIEEYLRPSTREWYAVRGIPYRRGYVCLSFSP
jgi:chaperone BCS1